MRLLRGPLVGGENALELAFAHAMLKEASATLRDETLRIYRPTEPVVVFGRRDTRLAGFSSAVAAAREHGFTAAVRPTGGRAVAYTDASLVVDHVSPDGDAMAGQEARFNHFGAVFADVFRGWGIDARVGAVPGEYCPGAQSVNARGTAKLVGTAQRVVRDAWLFSSLVVVGDGERIKPVLREVYRHLDQDFDEASVGSLSAEAPGIEIGAVERAIVQALVGAREVDLAAPDSATMDLALSLVSDHRLP